MMQVSEFRDFVEYVNLDVASRENLLNEGTSRQRYIDQRLKTDPSFADFAVEAVKLTQDVMTGRVPFYRLREAMTTSDFSTIFGNTLERLMVSGYERWQRTYTNYLFRSSVRDFRTVTRIDLYGGDDGLTRVGERGSYEEAALSERSYTLSVAKYGRKISMSWEMMVNDDVSAFANMPAVLGRAAAMAEHEFAVGLYATNTTLYSATHSVNGTNYDNIDTAALTSTSLEAAIEAMMVNGVDENEKPVMNAPRWLVVPPARLPDAKRALEVVQADQTSNVNVAATFGIQIVVEPFLPVVDPTNGNTSWYLFSEVAPTTYAAEVAFLAGAEQPQLFEMTSNQSALGGGDDGFSFENDTKQWKVRHVYGGSHANAIGHWRYTYWSNGTT